MLPMFLLYVHSRVLVLAMHFLFVSVFAAAYQLPVEGNFKDGRNNTIESADLKVAILVLDMPTMEMVNHCMGHVLDFGWWHFQATHELLVHR